MGEQFLGEIRLFAIGFAPRGWADCNGQIMSINSNQALFSLLGTTYGGNGVSTFALPDLRGKVPVGIGSSYPLGMTSGEASHTITTNEIPMHTHQVSASNVAASSVSPETAVWASSSNQFAASGNLGLMNAQAIGSAGGSQSHSNMQPYLTVRYCIALNGIYPSRN
ncbi:phage tail protein [Cohnella nanjingensis]|uniref:Phage tail protein n=1 Tax=Cohnella nanjingensis TaxID=1387779 RepID=A0A7X0VH02_9BACL|nr:tail fiber protein [Cohnella nanjingensis]MBB6672968.1 phage tail protein [Cohnella nanjingensis]